MAAFSSALASSSAAAAFSTPVPLSPERQKSPGHTGLSPIVFKLAVTSPQRRAVTVIGGSDSPPTATPGGLVSFASPALPSSALAARATVLAAMSSQSSDFSSAMHKPSSPVELFPSFASSSSSSSCAPSLFSPIGGVEGLEGPFVGRAITPYAPSPSPRDTDSPTRPFSPPTVVPSETHVVVSAGRCVVAEPTAGSLPGSAAHASSGLTSHELEERAAKEMAEKEMAEKEMAEKVAEEGEETPDAFQVRIDVLCQRTLLKAKTILLRDVPELESEECGVSIVVTGSDGRGEKLSDESPVELIVLVTNKPDVAVTVQKIADTVKRHKGLFFPQLECKDLSNPTESVIRYIGDKVVSVIPTRAMDATLVAGSSVLYNDYVSRCFAQIKGMSIEDLKSFDNRFRQPAMCNLSKMMLENEKRRDTRHCDLKTGVMNYNGTNVKGVKFAQLRGMQYSVAFCVFKNIIGNRIDEATFRRMPKSVLSRLSFLREIKVLPLSVPAMKVIQTAYQRALTWYYESQNQFEKHQVTVTRADPVKFAGMSQTIREFNKTVP